MFYKKYFAIFRDICEIDETIICQYRLIDIVA